MLVMKMAKPWSVFRARVNVMLGAGFDAIGVALYVLILLF
jgi:hypothetical protein